MQHYHSMAHHHNKGTMNITGSIGRANSDCSFVPAGVTASGAFTTSNANTTHYVNINSGSGSRIYAFNFNANNANAWTGLTSNVLNSSGSAITNSLTGGSVNSSASARTNTDNSGGSENRPDNLTIKIWKRVL